MITTNERLEETDNALAMEEMQNPCVPCGYTLRAVPLPLISAADGRWIARAVHDESSEEGILIYEDDAAIIFLTADEVAMSLAYLIQEAWNLIPAIDLALSPLHAQAVDHMRSLWWLEETRKAREVLSSWPTTEEVHA